MLTDSKDGTCSAQVGASRLLSCDKVIGHLKLTYPGEKHQVFIIYKYEYRYI